MSTKAEIDAAVKAHKKVIVRYTANWCNPCKLIKPVYEKEQENLKEMKSDIVYLTFKNKKDENGDDEFPDMDIQDENGDAKRVGIPLFKFFYKGEEVENLRCNGNKKKLLDTIKDFHEL